MEQLKEALSTYEDVEKEESTYAKKLLENLLEFDPEEYQKLKDKLALATFALVNAVRDFIDADEYRRGKAAGM